MYCGNCGKQVTNDINFCPNCGTKIYKEKTPPATPEKSIKKKILERLRSFFPSS